MSSPEEGDRLALGDRHCGTGGPTGPDPFPFGPPAQASQKAAKKTTAKIAKKTAAEEVPYTREAVAAAWCLLDSDTRSLVSWNYPPSHMPSAEE